MLRNGYIIVDNKIYNHFPNSPGVYVIHHEKNEIKIGHSENVSRRMHEHKGYRTNNTLPNVVLVLQTEDHAALEQEMHRLAGEYGLSRNGNYEHFCGDAEMIARFIDLMQTMGNSRNMKVVTF